jgi:hypothetical protein
MTDFKVGDRVLVTAPGDAFEWLRGVVTEVFADDIPDDNFPYVVDLHSDLYTGGLAFKGEELEAVTND